MKITLKLDTRDFCKRDIGHPIAVYVSHVKRKLYYTGKYAHINEWNDQLGRVTKDHPEFYTTNDYLAALKSNISEVLMVSNRQHLPMDVIKEMLFRSKSTLFFDVAMDLLGHGSKTSAVSAVKAFNSVYPAIKVLEINKNLVDNFIRVLLEKGNRPGGVDSYVRSLRAIWNKVSDQPNPFSGHTFRIPKKINVVATKKDIEILANADLRYNGTVGGFGRYRDYWLLCYYLGGLDIEALSRLRYDQNLVNGRIAFHRQKGNSNMGCNNLIPLEAARILENYDCRPFLVPIHQAKTYKLFVDNYRSRLRLLCRNLGLSVELRPKSARYSFIHHAQEQLIDERITAQIVGHKRKTVTSLYTNDFALETQDKAHLRIIS